MISWVIYVAIGLVVGGGAGFFLARLDDFSKKERQAMQEKLAEAEKQMANYKHEVTEHFIETAGLINTMTESYQAVHEHLAKGALSLCDHQVAVKRLKVTTTDMLDKPDDKTIDAAPVKTPEPVTPRQSASVSSSQAQATDDVDEYAQEQSSIKVQSEQTEDKITMAGTEDTELSGEKEQETEEQKALEEKQAAAMASRMVH